MINGGMGFASRDYAGERNWLIIDNDQNGRAMVLTGALYAQFEAQMGAKTAWTGTPEEVLVAQDEIILKFFAACEEEGYEFLRENNAL
ncbi:MAG: hypothetical protein NTX48_00055 [Planctomycetales bacterium]|nr:hypothetical protein [Planctomycetales bacterium]